MHMKKIIIYCLVFAILFSGLSFANISKQIKAEPYGGILKAAVMDEMKTRNILNVSDNDWTWKVLSPVYDTAIKVDKVTGEPMPHIMKGTETNGIPNIQSAEEGVFNFLPGLEEDIIAYYDFTGVKFHDGEQVDVMDVIFSYHITALHPKWYPSVTSLMDGAGLFGNFTSDRWLFVWDVSDQYSTDGDSNTSALRFRITANYTRLWTDTMGIPILPRHIWEGSGGGIHDDFGYAIDSNGKGIPPTNPNSFDMITGAINWEPTDDEVIGNGPFEFDEWISGSHARLYTYLDYYPSKAFIDGIEFIKYSTAQQQVIALKNGDVDAIASSIPPHLMPDLFNEPNITLLQNPDMYFGYVGFNMRSSIFGYPGNDPSQGDAGKPLRQAIAYLLDKMTIVDVYLQGYGVMAWGPVSPQNTLWYNTSLLQYGYSIGNAENILDLYGYIDGDFDDWRDIDINTPGDQDDPIELIAPTLEYDSALAQSCTLLETNMKAAKLNVFCSYQSFESILGKIHDRNFDMYILYWDDATLDPWSIELGDPDYLFDMFYSLNSEQGRNYPGYQDLTFDVAIVDSRSEMTPTNRQALIKWAQGMISEDLPIIPLYYKTNIWAYRHDRFVNWTLLNSIFNYWSYIGIHMPDTLDTTPPTITNLQPPNESITNDTTPTISANYSDLSGINVSSVLLKVDGVNVTSLATITEIGATYTPISALRDGVHTAYLEVKDTYGNLAMVSWSFTVDTQTPPKPPSDFLDEYWWVLLVIIVVLIIVIILFILLWRRKKKDEDISTTQETQEMSSENLQEE